jgi:hypothetical protein
MRAACPDQRGLVTLGETMGLLTSVDYGPSNRRDAPSGQTTESVTPSASR